MAEIKLKKRYKYAGDIFQKLIGIGFDVETATAFLNEVKDADVEENKDCEQCIHSGKHATEYPCSYCRNCYTDKFQPNNTRTPQKEVRHGHWIPSSNGINPIRCSECNMPAPFAAGENEFGDFEICRYPSSYCHECGAKMEGKGDSDGE